MFHPVIAIKNDWNCFKPICVGSFANVRIVNMKRIAKKPKNGPAVIESNIIGPTSVAE